MFRKLLLIFIIVSMLFNLTSCTKEEAGNQNTLRLVSAYDLETLDASKSTDGYMGILNVFDRLFDMKLQEDGTSIIVPSLCENYSISEDGLTYHFEIKKDVVFSNGNPLTSSDVKYTFERLLIEDDYNTDIVSEVVGADEMFEGLTETLSGFNICDDYSFDITLYAPNPAFIAELTSVPMSIVDKETIENGIDFGLDCNTTVGTGPYKLQEWEVNDHITFIYNDKYWGEEPDVKEFTIKIIPEVSTQDLMFQSGEIDILCLSGMDITLINSVYKANYEEDLVITPQVGIRYLSLNENQKYLSDVRVRKAIQLAIDVDSIIDNLFGEYAKHEHGLIPTGTIGHNDNIKTSIYDPEEAEKILKDAGYAENEIEFEFAFDSSDSEVYEIMYDMIIQNLKDVGINAYRKNYEQSAWYDARLSGDLDSYIGAWAMDYNDPSNIMISLFGNEEISKSRSYNYYDLETMGRVSNATRISDEQLRLQEYQELEKKIVVEDAAIVPMFEIYTIYVKGEKVSEMIPFWSGYENTYDIRYVKLK